MSKRNIYILLAIFLGGIGVHKFYVGKSWQGILYFLFSLSLIPAIIALIEGLVTLGISDEEFNERYNMSDGKSSSYISELSQLKTLKDSGIISEDEFENKKKAIIFK